MSFLTDLPKTYQSLKIDRAKTRWKSIELWSKLDESDEVETHSCNCSECPVNKKSKPLSPREYADLEDEANTLDETIDLYDKTIKSVEGYAKLMKVELPT